jgi:hypothetical protein
MKLGLKCERFVVIQNIDPCILNEIINYIGYDKCHELNTKYNFSEINVPLMFYKDISNINNIKKIINEAKSLMSDGYIYSSDVVNNNERLMINHGPSIIIVSSSNVKLKEDDLGTMRRVKIIN